MLEAFLKIILLLGIPVTHLVVILMIRRGITPKTVSFVFTFGLTSTIVGSLAFVALRQGINMYILLYLATVSVLLFGIGYGVSLFMFKLIIDRSQDKTHKQ